MIIGAKFIKRPKKVHRCDNCGKLLEEHIALFGMATRGDPPYTIRYHPNTKCLGLASEELRKRLAPILFAAEGKS